MDTGSSEPGTGARDAPAPDAPAPDAPPPAAAPGRGSRRTLLVLGSVIAGVALASVLVLIATSRPPAAYPAGSPEAAFQGYLQAWESDDVAAAYASLSDRIRGDVTMERYRTMLDEYGWVRDTDRRVVLLASRVNGDDATLDLRIDESAGVMGGGVYSREANVRLVREDGSWHVDELLAGLEPMWYEE